VDASADFPQFERTQPHITIGNRTVMLDEFGREDFDFFGEYHARSIGSLAQRREFRLPGGNHIEPRRGVDVLANRQRHQPIRFGRELRTLFVSGARGVVSAPEQLLSFFEPERHPGTLGNRASHIYFHGVDDLVLERIPRCEIAILRGVARLAFTTEQGSK
jgi:hypothetical protein